MNIKLYQRIMLIGFLLFGSIGGYIIFTSSPEGATLTLLSVIYFCIFSAVFTISSLVLSVFKSKELKPELIVVKIKSITRQSFLVALFIVSLMFLGSIDLLTWWDALLLAFSLILFELYFKSNRRRLN